MIDDIVHGIVTAMLFYLLIGSIVWVALDPVAYRDFVVRRYAQRYGRLPGRDTVTLAHMVAIVAWPNTVSAMIRVMIEKVRG